jgi:hypothetical protein
VLMSSNFAVLMSFPRLNVPHSAFCTRAMHVYRISF